MSTSAEDQRSIPCVLVQPPAAHVVRGGDDAGPDPLGDERLDHEPADLGLDTRRARRCPRRSAPRPPGRRAVDGCGRARSGTSRCRSASGSSSAAGRSGAARTRRGRGRSASDGRACARTSGVASSGHPHSAIVSEYSSSLRDGVLKPRRATPSTIGGDRVRAAGERHVRAVERRPS